MSSTPSITDNTALDQLILQHWTGRNLAGSHTPASRDQKSLLKEWDLWGPLILCTLMATILQVHCSLKTTLTLLYSTVHYTQCTVTQCTLNYSIDTYVQGHDSEDKSADGDGGPEFAEVFVIVWVSQLCNNTLCIVTQFAHESCVYKGTL